MSANQELETSSVRFSVVVPAYNAANTIARAIDSVRAQTYLACEVIVVDDGSADDTARVVERLAVASSIPVRLIRQRNGGPSAARNAGVQAALGEWVAFLDADDWYLPRRLQVHAEMIGAEPGLDFLVGGFEYVTAEGHVTDRSLTRSVLGQRLLTQHGAGGRTAIAGDDIGAFIAEQFSDTRSLSLPRATFLQLGGFPLDLRICEDLVFLLRLAAASRRVGVACDSLSAYVIHDDGLIRSDRLRAQFESVRALRTLLPEMRDAPAPVRTAWQRLLKDAYRDLAYHLAKLGRRGEALSALVQSFRFKPSWRDGRDMLSVLRR